MSAPAPPSPVPDVPSSAPRPSPLDHLLDSVLEVRAAPGDAVVVTVRGPLDRRSERTARATMTAAASTATGPVVVVLDEAFVDFRGLGVLLGVARTCRRRGHMLRLVGAPPSLRTMCGALGVRNCWWEFESAAEALVPRPAEEAEQLRQETRHD
jgi:anti-anti-sigma factor